jgi:hypothetical protein
LGTSLDYYSNVRNAFLTAPALASAVANLPGAHKVVIAHSLGNMVVSSAIVDSGMSVEKYFAIDAAVAMEAYDGSIKDLGMVNPNAGYPFQGWPNYDQRLWSTEWYQLFDSVDGRSGLTWRDRFDAIPNLYNFYSSGEEVLENPPVIRTIWNCVPSASRGNGVLTGLTTSPARQIIFSVSEP